MLIDPFPPLKQLFGPFLIITIREDWRSHRNQRIGKTMVTCISTTKYSYQTYQAHVKAGTEIVTAYLQLQVELTTPGFQVV
jgi:hypothetical protein